MNWRGIVIHHSLTPDTATASWPAILRFHTVDRQWRDIGYHAGIEDLRGTLMCLYGRPTTEEGAHTVGRNHDHLGFCFVGNFDMAPPSDEMMKVAARRVLRPWMKLFCISIANVLPHNAFAKYKTCPGEQFSMDRLRDILQMTETGT